MNSLRANKFNNEAYLCWRQYKKIRDCLFFQNVCLSINSDYEKLKSQCSKKNLALNDFLEPILTTFINEMFNLKCVSMHLISELTSMFEEAKTFTQTTPNNEINWFKLRYLEKSRAVKYTVCITFQTFYIFAKTVQNAALDPVFLTQV